ncbi:A-kinase anchor protein 12 [Centropristis striata]|uniref:A-kinase anchor protein 12 n=1 Tax=Centropristis striata TaxID=184440 RepID=UPI0027DF8F95|nr:A-kinase anchor protein 12 [Centropristis striata]
MGDAQSAQREDKKDAEEESGKVDDAQQNIEDKPLTNNGLISEINGKADGSIAEVNGHCEDEMAAEAILSPDKDVSETEKPLKEEETPLKHVEINEKESPNEADANEDVPLEMIEMDAKQNDINESFRRFFGNIGLKLTVKRGTGDIATDASKSNKEEPSIPEDVEDTAKETTSENAEHNTDVNMAQETYDNDSTTCPTLTDATSEDVLDNAEEKTTETKEKVESDNADAATTTPEGENAHQDTTPEKMPHSTSLYGPEEEVTESPIKRFFTTGIFSGLKKKKKPAEVETTDKELKEIVKKEVMETAEEAVQDQDKEEISLGVEAAAVETEHEIKGEIPVAASAQKTDASTIDPSTIIASEPEILNSQEKDKVQASPLKRLLSGSSFKKISKKPRGRKSSDARLSDSGEHVSDQLLSSNESAEHQKEEGPTQPSAEAAGEEDSAWVSFKKLLTPKKRMKRPSLGNEEMQIPSSVEEPKPSEEGQISDHSTEEGKKRKDSTVSWEAVLCGSGRRRSRKTSDSEDETPLIDNDINKQDGGSKNGAESALESSCEADEIIAYSPKRAGSPSEGDGGSTWKSLKRLVTPKRKARDEDESKDNVHSDNEITQDESSFSIKKLLPGRKKRKPAEKQDQVSSDEADKDVASGDEDSETPAVVPLSEFDTVETEVHIQTQADMESHIPKEADHELHQDLLEKVAEPVIPGDSLQTEEKKAQANEDALENKTSTTPAANEEPDDSTESSSKPQLSDIPEEATPASFTEDAARDDTIAEDLIEITSEAITAPEPLDTTLADETEMISAVSQLSSESSKTSGNTTPVPAEYDVQETDALLHKVVETVSKSPKAVQVCSDELQSDRMTASDLPQILETFVKEEQTTLDTIDINTGPNVGELDANNELASTTQTESISEVNDSVSTEIISEVPTEEFDTAEIAADEVHELDVTHPEESVKELDSIDESLNLVESELNVSVCTDILPEGDKIVPAEGSSIEAHQTETQPPKLDSQKADSAATAVDETKDGPMEQEVKSLTEKEGQIMENITEQTQHQEKDQPPTEVAVHATLDSEEASVEKDAISEDIPAAKTDTCEPKEETAPPSEVIIKPEKEDELETDAAKPVHVQVPEASEAVQASTLDSEKGAVQSPKEVKSEDFPPADTDEPEQTAECLTEFSVEPENKESPVNVQEDTPEAETITVEPKAETKPLTEDSLEPVDTAKTENVQDSEVSAAVHAPTIDSVEGSVQSLEKEAISEDTPEAKTVTDEPEQTAECLTKVSVEPENKELPVNVQEDTPEAETITVEPKAETKPLTEDSLEPVDTAKTENVQDSEVSAAVHAPTIDSVEGSVQSLEKEAISEDTPEAKTVTDEPEQTAECLTKASVEPENKELPVNVQEDTPKAETITDEPKEETKPLTEDNLEPVGTAKTEHVQEPEVLQTVQAATLDLEAGSLLSLGKTVLSEDIPAVKTVIEEPKQEPDVKAEEQQAEASETEHVQEPEVLEAVQAPTSDLEVGSLQSLEKEVISDGVPVAETVADEAGKEIIPPTEVNLEPVDTSKDILAAETVTEQPKQETDVEPEEQQPEEASKTKHVEEPEVLEAFQAPTAEVGSLQSLEKEVISEDVPEPETITVKDDAGKEMTPKTEVNLEPVDASKDIPATEIVTEQPKQETDVEPEQQKTEEASKTEHVQEPEVLEAVQAPTSDLEGGSVQSLEKEVISEDVPVAETVADEAGKETIPPTEVNLEPVDASKDIPAAETITKEPKWGTKIEQEQNLPVEAAKTEHVQEPEVLPSDVTKTKTNEGPSTCEDVVTESLEGGVAQQILLEDISKPNVDPVIASVTDGIKKEVVAPLDQSIEIKEDQKTESILQGGIEQEDCVSDATTLKLQMNPNTKRISVRCKSVLREKKKLNCQAKRYRMLQRSMPSRCK